MQVLLGPGDHAVVITPNYQAAETVPLALCEVSGVALRPGRTAGRWTWTRSSGAAPEHPGGVGQLPQQPDRRGARRRPTSPRWPSCATQRGIHLFSDEVYRGLELDPARTLPQAADLSPTALSLNVMSKAYGLPGLRIGWIACRDRALLRRLERAKHYTTICNSAPERGPGPIALEAREPILDRNRAIVAANLPAVRRVLRRVRPSCSSGRAPQGGCVCLSPLSGRGRGGAVLRRSWWRRPACCCCPRASTARSSPPLPADRFRVGVGRRDPEPGLAAFAAWLRARR